MMLDPRLNAYRPDLADERLRGQVEAERFVEGKLHQVTVPVAAMHGAPDAETSLTSQVLFGEQVVVLDVKDGWAWGQTVTDGYVGYIPAETLSQEITTPTHRVCVLSSYLYRQPAIKTQPAVPVFLNSPLTITAENGEFAQLADGRFVWARHICPLTEHDDDPAAVAERFQHVPYLWGGKTQAGMDCSGLVQSSYLAAGRACPRDSDMMQSELGEPLLINNLDGLQRGDLVFWQGHVGIMLDSERVTHANGYHMTTVIEPLAKAVERIATLFGPVTGFRRP
jgi:cell wall-associated NlpC family hydrolase